MDGVVVTTVALVGKYMRAFQCEFKLKKQKKKKERKWCEPNGRDGPDITAWPNYALAVCYMGANIQCNSMNWPPYRHQAAIGHRNGMKREKIRSDYNSLDAKSQVFIYYVFNGEEEHRLHRLTAARRQTDAVTGDENSLFIRFAITIECS